MLALSILIEMSLDIWVISIYLSIYLSAFIVHQPFIIQSLNQSSFNQSSFINHSSFNHSSCIQTFIIHHSSITMHSINLKPGKGCHHRAWHLSHTGDAPHIYTPRIPTSRKRPPASGFPAQIWDFQPRFRISSPDFGFPVQILEKSHRPGPTRTDQKKGTRNPKRERKRERTPCSPKLWFR